MVRCTAAQCSISNRHGIFNNDKFEPDNPAPDWYWYDRYHKVPSMLDLAKKNGFTTASIGWPSTSGANVDYLISKVWTLSFPKGERAAEAVTLPHTWNAVDGMDGNGSYLRTTGVYSRTFKKPEQPLAGGRVYVEVLAAALDATVKVNGTVATTHEGGFSIFRADITDLCRDGDNELTIEVSNEDTPSMYPASADFTFYGGLYRGVNLISVPNAHFDLDYYGGPGIMVTPKPTADGGATFEIKSFVTNPDDSFTVMYSIEDPYGCEVASAVRPADSTAVTIYVPDAELWSMDEPNLYTVAAMLRATKLLP